MSKAVIEDEKELEAPVVEPDDLETEYETPEVEDIADPDDTEEEELIVTIGEDSPPSEEDKDKAPEWVRTLRKENSDKLKRIKELEAKLAQVEGPKKLQLGPKPTLESCDYDTEKFERDLDAWKERKAAHDRELEEQKAAAKKQEEAWKAKIEGFNARKAELKLRDYDEVEESVKDTFSDTQLGILVDGAKDPALLLYALGKDQARLAEIASIQHPIHFAFAVARMETQLKTTSRKPSAAPEKPVRGSAPTSGADKQLEKLREEAARTGDATKLMAYKRGLKK